MPTAPYPRTKPTAIPWIGEVPEHWEVRRLSSLGEFFKGSGIARADITASGVPAITYGDIYTRYGIEAKALLKYTSPETAAGAQSIQKGDLLFTASGETVEDIGKTTMYSGDETGYAGGDIIILRPSGGDPLYLSYALNSELGIHQKSLFGRGDIIVHISASNLKQVVVPFPPQEEQTLIARYLDHKTALIDAYLSQKRRMVELLKEHRQALINQAVTKGLDPQVKLKPSGIEWIEEVPEHWEVSRVKYQCSVRGRIGFRGYEKDDLVESGEGALVIGGKHITDDRLDLSDPDFLRWGKYYESPEIMIKRGDIVVTQRGSLGKVTVIEEDLGPATINPSMILLTDIACASDYLGFFFKSAFFKSYIDLINTATAVPMISQEQLGNVAVPLPPKSEQVAIASTLRDRTAEIDDELSRIAASMERVQEYRQALISAVVMGKVDVRDQMIGRIDDQMMSGSADQMIGGSEDKAMEYGAPDALSIAAEPGE